MYKVVYTKRKFKSEDKYEIYPIKSEHDGTRAIGCEYKINNGKEVNNMNIKMAIRTNLNVCDMYVQQ